VDANKYLGEYIINIGGQDRKVRFSMLEAMNLERRMKRSLLTLTEADLSVTFVAELLHMGLQIYHPALKIDTVAGWMTAEAHRFEELIKFCGEALANVLGRPDPNAPKKEADGGGPLASSAGVVEGTSISSSATPMTA
jgi:hypothetical protein